MDRILQRNNRIDIFSRKLVEPWIVKNRIKVENFEPLLKDYKSYYDGYKDLYLTGAKSNLFQYDFINNCICNLFLGVTQQFCFWVIPGNSAFRTKLTSGNIVTLTSNADWKETYLTLKAFIDENAITLRKERIEILDRAYDHLMCNFNTSLIDLVYYLLSFQEFKNDYFFKKGNLFLMEIDRISKMLEANLNEEDLNKLAENDMKGYQDLIEINWSKYYGPAIDYQIPKVLRELDVISYPKNIQEDITAGKLIQKDSISELTIRSIVWVAVKEIAKHYKLTDEEVDNIIFFNRNSIKCKDGMKPEKSHACLTTAY